MACSPVVLSSLNTGTEYIASAYGAPVALRASASAFKTAWALASVSANSRAGSESATMPAPEAKDRKSTRLNSSHLGISYAVFCLKKKKEHYTRGKDQPYLE